MIWKGQISVHIMRNATYAFGQGVNLERVDTDEHGTWGAGGDRSSISEGCVAR